MVVNTFGEQCWWRFFWTPRKVLRSSQAVIFCKVQGKRTTFSSVQSLSHVWLFATPWTAACQASLSITNSQSLLKLMSIELVVPSNHLIPCRPLFLPPLIFSSIRVFSNESVLHIRWPKYWSFSFNIGPSNEHPGLISFRIDWFVDHNFPLRSKRVLISWLQSPSAVILEPRKIKSATVSTVSPSICHEVMGPEIREGKRNPR